MEKKNEILQELAETGNVIADIEAKQVYNIPADYFSTVEREIMQKIEGNYEPVYYFDRSNTYAVPDGYFENVTGTILGKLKHNATVEELEQIAPLLNIINKKAIYTVPQGYLETVHTQISSHERSSGRVFSLFSRSSFRYLVAAVITGVLAVGGFLLSPGNNGSVTASTDQTKTEIKKLSDEDIADFLRPGQSADEVAGASYISNKQIDIGNYIKELPDEEIKEYLQETGEHEEI